jgi:N-glycosylase/DNA lyase
LEQNTLSFPVSNYDLEKTLNSGQAFRWRLENGAWTGVVGGRWLRLSAEPGIISAQVATAVSDWNWVSEYLQIGAQLDQILATFPEDDAMRVALHACAGLRLLRQDPWECLASFILSSTKQIVQIRQIIQELTRRFGQPLCVPSGFAPAWSFPSAEVLASVPEAELRGCKMGFRAPFLAAAARHIASGDLDLESLRNLPLAEARERLMELPGVGAKIADCALLFAYGFPKAFPIDVWIFKAIKELYFPPRARRKLNLGKIRVFAENYFGPNAGYAQQYLFHYMRTRARAGSPQN